MPLVGVKINTSSLAGRSNAGVQSGRWFIAGTTDRGQQFQPAAVRSIAQFESAFGGRTPYNSPLYDAVRLFFEEGGSEAVIARVVGPSAVPDTLTLNDAASATAMTLSTIGAGGGSDTVATVVDVTTANGMISVLVTLRDTTNGITSDLAVESFRGTTPLAIFEQINARSGLVTATAGDGLAEMTGLATLDGETLTGGDADRSSITNAHYMQALDAMGEEWGTGAVSVPGIPADSIGVDLLAYAKRTGRIALMSGDPDGAQADVEATAQTLGIADGAEYGAVFFPWVSVRDGASTRLAPPEAFAAAKRSVAHTQVGPWKVPAGQVSDGRWMLGGAVTLSTEDNDRLVTNRVSGIMTVAGVPKLYGWWSLSPDTETYYTLAVRDTLNYLAAMCRNALEPFVFDQIDGRGLLAGQIESALVGVLDPIARANGFYPSRNAEGVEIDPGYSVVVDETLNTPATISANKIIARVSVRLAPTAALIELDIVKVPFTGAVN